MLMMESVKLQHELFASDRIAQKQRRAGIPSPSLSLFSSKLNYLLRRWNIVVDDKLGPLTGIGGIRTLEPLPPLIRALIDIHTGYTKQGANLGDLGARFKSRRILIQSATVFGGNVRLPKPNGTVPLSLIDDTSVSL